MKRIFTCVLLLASLASPFKPLLAESNSTTFHGKVQMSLTYPGLGIRDEYQQFFFDGAEGTTIAIITAGVAPLVTLPFNIVNDEVQSISFKVKIKAILKEAGNDRISLRLSTSAKKSCAGFSIPLMGEGDGFGSYELYLNNEDIIANKSIGKLMTLEDQLLLDIDPLVDIRTSGARGKDCLWNTSNGLHLELKK
ncbi:MAG: hypothetical protein AB7I27_04125 [Bacteriovoracaceae bacterium]